MFLQQQLIAVVMIILVLTFQGSNATVKMHNVSSDYKLRRELLTSYDRFVRPVLSPLTKVNVSFSYRLVSLINVDNKKQKVTSKILIKQGWHNPFLTWNQSKFGGIDRIRMRKEEIWVPDITLRNSADNPSLDTQFLHGNWVTVYSNGTNVWVSLPILDSDCEIKVSNFPFDNQMCVLDFASESQDAESFNIYLIKHQYEKDKHFKQVSNGEWDIRDITATSVKEESHSWPAPFAHVKLNLTIQRIPTFYILYLICPCAVLSLLVFFSFVIPPENGERIGFCSSLLLSLSVYLLLFSDLLPKNSRNVSLLGVLFVLLFLEAALALILTLLVLKVYHATSQVPTLIKLLFLCECGSNKKKTNPKKNQVKPHEPTLKEEEPSLIISSECNLNADLPLAKLDERKENEENQSEIENPNQSEQNHQSWLKVARKLDRLFFWVFFIFLFVSMALVIIFSDKLSDLSQLDLV